MSSEVPEFLAYMGKSIWRHQKGNLFRLAMYVGLVITGASVVFFAICLLLEWVVGVVTQAQLDLVDGKTEDLL